MDTTCFYEFVKYKPKNNKKEFIKKYGMTLYKKLHQKAKMYYENLYKTNFDGYDFHNFGIIPEDYFNEGRYVPLTKEQHTFIHWKGKQRTKKNKQKISETKKGKNHPNYGKHLPLKTRQKISETESWNPSKEIIHFIEIHIDQGCTRTFVGNVLGKERHTISKYYNKIKEKNNNA